MSNPGSKLRGLVALLALSYGVLGVLSLARAQGNGSGSNVKHLSGLNCESGQVPKFDGSDWICAPDVTGITGVIAGPGLLGGGSSGNVTLSLDTSYLQQNYANVKIVAKSGGDFTTVGAALASITDNDPNNGYLVFVAPGTYNEAILLKPYVHLKGAGQGITVITSTVSALPLGVTILSVSNATLSDLTVITPDSSGPHTAILQFGGILQNVTVIADGANSRGIEIAGFGSNTLQNVTVRVSGGSSSSGIAVVGSVAFASIQNSTVTVSGSGVNKGIFVQASANIDNSVVVASGAGSNYGISVEIGGATIRNSVISANGGSNAGIFLHDAGIIFASSSVTGSGGTSNYGILAPGPRNFAAITNSTITASGGTTSIGISAPEIRMTIDASRLIGGTTALSGGSPASIKVGASMVQGAVMHSGQFACAGVYNGDYIALNSICQ